MAEFLRGQPPLRRPFPPHDSLVSVSGHRTLDSAYGSSGSFAHTQPANTRTFDQPFTWLASKLVSGRLQRAWAVWPGGSVKRLGHTENSLHYADTDPQNRDGSHFAGPLRSELEDALPDFRGYLGSVKGLCSRLRPGKASLCRLTNDGWQACRIRLICGGRKSRSGGPPSSG